MRKHLFGLTAFCATCLALGAQAQSHSGGTSTDSTLQDSSKPSTWDRIKNLAATGRTHQDIRGSQLTSAEVKSSTGDTIGTISDVIINPTSGKVDFAILALNGSSSSSSQYGTSSSGRTGTTAPASAGSSSTAGGTKQVAIPWSLLRSADTGSSTTSSSMAKATFTYSGDLSKLQSAPSFDPNTDMTQPGWFQSVFSYFGVNQNSGTGAATSPGSSSTGSASGNRSYPDGNPSNNP
jgi:sporulation protein YlmC with PRC-barrel domain